MNERDRKDRFSRIQNIGCLACRKRGWYEPTQAHHLNLDGKAGQVRRSGGKYENRDPDEYTIGLCPWHHQGIPKNGAAYSYMVRVFGPTLQYHSRAFRKAFGTDDELLRWENELIQRDREGLVGARVA